MASLYKLIMVLKLKLLFSCLPFYNPFCLFLFSNFEMGIQLRLTSSFPCSPGSPRTFKTHPLPPKCQAYRFVPPHLNYAVLGWEPRTSCMLDKYSTTWIMFPALLYTWKLNLQLTGFILFHLYLFGHGYSVWQLGIPRVCVAEASLKRLLSLSTLIS